MEHLGCLHGTNVPEIVKRIHDGRMPFLHAKRDAIRVLRTKFTAASIEIPAGRPGKKGDFLYQLKVSAAVLGLVAELAWTNIDLQLCMNILKLLGGLPVDGSATSVDISFWTGLSKSDRTANVYDLNRNDIGEFGQLNPKSKLSIGQIADLIEILETAEKYSGRFHKAENRIINFLYATVRIALNKELNVMYQDGDWCDYEKSQRSNFVFFRGTKIVMLKAALALKTMGLGQGVSEAQPAEGSSNATVLKVGSEDSLALQMASKVTEMQKTVQKAAEYRGKLLNAYDELCRAVEAYKASKLQSDLGRVNLAVKTYNELIESESKEEKPTIEQARIALRSLEESNGRVKTKLAGAEAEAQAAHEAYCQASRDPSTLEKVEVQKKAEQGVLVANKAFKQAQQLDRDVELLVSKMQQAVRIYEAQINAESVVKGSLSKLIEELTVEGNVDVGKVLAAKMHQSAACLRETYTGLLLVECSLPTEIREVEACYKRAHLYKDFIKCLKDYYCGELFNDLHGYIYDGLKYVNFFDSVIKLREIIRGMIDLGLISKEEVKQLPRFIDLSIVRAACADDIDEVDKESARKHLTEAELQAAVISRSRNPQEIARLNRAVHLDSKLREAIESNGDSVIKERTMSYPSRFAYGLIGGVFRWNGFNCNRVIGVVTFSGGAGSGLVSGVITSALGISLGLSSTGVGIVFGVATAVATILLVYLICFMVNAINILRELYRMHEAEKAERAAASSAS